jgi:hypothetical protein
MIHNSFVLFALLGLFALCIVVGFGDAANYSENQMIVVDFSGPVSTNLRNLRNLQNLQNYTYIDCHVNNNISNVSNITDYQYHLENNKKTFLRQNHPNSYFHHCSNIRHVIHSPCMLLLFIPCLFLFVDFYIFYINNVDSSSYSYEFILPMYEKQM